MGGIGIIDIGSNGIRFGLVSSLTRHLPVVYEERAPISLYKARFPESKSDEHTDDIESESNERKDKIPEEVIVEVENTLNRFKQIAQGYQIDQSDVHVTATAATRDAPNGCCFIKRIKDSTGWVVEILSESEEAKISGLGIVATYYGVKGLVMDMGGGSVELNYVCHQPHEANQDIPMSTKPINLRYGAAALTKLLEEKNTPEQRKQLFETIVGEFNEKFNELNVPANIKEEDGSYTIYMTGGGFRSLGYLSMSETEFINKHTNQKSSYPIPIINGYSTSTEELLKITKRIAPNHDGNVVESSDEKNLFPKGNPFRISKRRAKLLPASAFLFEAIMEVFKAKYVHFCDGGVRQGYCFNIMPKSEWAVDPLESFIKCHPFQPRHLEEAHYNQLLNNVKKVIPSVAYEILDSDIPLSSNKPKRLERLLPNLIYLAYWSMHFGKEARPIAAFQLSLAGGPLANAPGLTHIDRAIIAWCLMYRYHEDGSGPKSGGVEKDVSMMAPMIFDGVKKLVPGGKDGRKVCEIVGKLIGFSILCYPVNKSCDSLLPEKLDIFESIEEDCEIGTKDIEQDRPKKRHTILLVLSDDSISTKSKVSLIDNSLVKEASEKLEKTYTLGGKGKKEKKRTKNMMEIRIKIKKWTAF